MTPEEREIILALGVGIDGLRQISPEDALLQLGSNSGAELGSALLRAAVANRDSVEVGLALIACFTFGFTGEHFESLIELSSADWHTSHEDVATALGRLGGSDCVAALFYMAEWILDYLDYDDSRALATKSIWALGGIPGSEAEQALQRLAASENEIVRNGAEAQLRRRST